LVKATLGIHQQRISCAKTETKREILVYKNNNNNSNQRGGGGGGGGGGEIEAYWFNSKVRGQLPAG